MIYASDFTGLVDISSISWAEWNALAGPSTTWSSVSGPSTSWSTPSGPSTTWATVESPQMEWEITTI